MRVQLIGAITGTDDYRYRFARVEKQLTELGYSVINPVLIGEKVLARKSNPKHEDFMKATIKSLVDADAVCCLDGWENSKGATIEVEVAKAIGLTFIEYKMLGKKW